MKKLSKEEYNAIKDEKQNTSAKEQLNNVKTDITLNDNTLAPAAFEPYYGYVYSEFIYTL